MCDKMNNIITKKLINGICKIIKETCLKYPSYKLYCYCSTNQEAFELFKSINSHLNFQMLDYSRCSFLGDKIFIFKNKSTFTILSAINSNLRGHRYNKVIICGELERDKQRAIQYHVIPYDYVKKYIIKKEGGTND